MKKNIALLLLSFVSGLCYAQYHPFIEKQLSSQPTQILSSNKKSMSLIPQYLFILEESGDDFFKYDLYIPNSEFAVKMLTELNSLMNTDPKFWKRKYILSQKTEIELTESDRKFLGKANFPRISMDQYDLKKYSNLVNKLSIVYDELIKSEKIEIEKLPRSERKLQETRMEIIERTWQKQLQDNQDMIINWSKTL